MNKVIGWFLAKDWRTWLSHVLMAAALGLVAVPLFDVALEKGLLIGVCAYWWREAEQVFEQYRTDGMAAVHAHALDHCLDAAAPFLAFVLWAALA
jgi:hypothetical protein